MAAQGFLVALLGDGLARLELVAWRRVVLARVLPGVVRAVMRVPRVVPVPRVGIEIVVLLRRLVGRFRLELPPLRLDQAAFLALLLAFLARGPPA